MENTSEEKTRFCPRCERTLPLNGFSRAPERRDGIRSICKNCEGVLGKARTESLKQQIYDKLGNSCCRCGFSDKRALQIDHVNGGGNQEHSEIKNHLKFLKKVLEDADGNYQILCANCNWIKRIELKEHRKQNPFTSEEIEKILQSNYGKPVSGATRKRLSDAGKSYEHQKTGLPAWNRGVPRPDELKERLSQIAAEIQAARPAEERQRIARERDANMTPEQRSDRAKAGAETLRLKRETEGWTPAPQKSRTLNKTQIVNGVEVPYKHSLEARMVHSEAAKKRHSSRTSEQKEAINLKRKATWAAKKTIDSSLPIAA